MKIVGACREALCSRGIVGIWVEQIVSHQLDVGRTTPPKRLVFWDGALSLLALVSILLLAHRRL